MVLLAHITPEKNKSEILKKGLKCNIYPDSKSVYFGKCGNFFRPFDDPKYNAIELLTMEEKNYLSLHADQKELSLQKELSECDSNKKTPLRIEWNKRYINDLSDKIQKKESGLANMMVLVDIPESDIRVGDGENEPYKEIESYKHYIQQNNMLYPEIFIERDIRANEILGVINNSTIYNLISKCGSNEKCIKEFLDEITAHL